MPSSIVVVPRRPARARRADARRRRHAHAVERRPAYCVSDAIVSCWVERDARRRRVDEEQVDVGVGRRRCGRARRARSAALANGTCHFTPSSTKPSPSAVAVGLHAPRAEAAAGLEPRGRDDRLAGRDPRAATPAAARRCRRAAARPRSSPRSRSAATARARGRAPRRRPRPRAASCPSRRTRRGSMSPIRSSSPAASRARRDSRPDRPPARAPSRAARSELHTPRTISRSISCSSVKSRSIASRPPVGLTVASGRRGGVQGLSSSSIGQRDARGAVGLEVAVDGEAHEQRRPSRSRRRRSRRRSTVPREHHRVAGEDRALHAELHAAEPARRARSSR